MRQGFEQDTAKLQSLLHDPLAIPVSPSGAYQPSMLPVATGLLYAAEIQSRNPRITESLPYRAHVISLENSRRMWRFAKNYNLSQPFHVFPAVNAMNSEFKHSAYPELKNLRPVEGQEGHCGCTLSHFYLWRSLDLESTPYFFVFEDDAIFAPYADSMITELTRVVPEDADVVFINGRCSEKVYLKAYYSKGRWEGLPNQFLLPRSEVIEIMRKNLARLRRNANGLPYFYSGTDGYLLTRSGVTKLINHLDQFGFCLRPSGAGYNIDHFLTAITTKVSDHRPHPMAYDIDRYIKGKVIQEMPLLNGYVAVHPIVDVAQRLGYGKDSEIANK